jgi:hypothetical protein
LNTIANQGVCKNDGETDAMQDTEHNETIMRVHPRDQGDDET